MKPLKIRAWDDILNEMIYSKPEQFDDSLLFRFDKHFETEKPIYMEFTGVMDKNKVEIYEGDLVTVTYGRYELEPNGLKRTGRVIYDKSTARFAISIKNSAVLVSFYDVNKIEITGNIYETTLEVTP